MVVEFVARDTVNLLSPYVSMLSNNGEKVFKDSDQVQERRYAKSLWEHIQFLFNKGDTDPSEIVQDFIKAPNNEIVQAIFRHQLSKLLKEDNDLAKELEELIYVEG